MSQYIKDLPNGPARAQLIKKLRQYPVDMLLEAVKDNEHHRSSPYTDKKMYKIKELEVLKATKPEFWKEEDDRFTLFPINLKDIWHQYNLQKAAFWTAGDVTFEKDNYDSLSDDKKRILKHVMGFFSAADAIVNENIFSNLLKRMPAQEARCMYMFQGAQENVHSEVYSRMIDRYIEDPEEKREMFRAALNMEAVKKKIDWATRWLEEAEGIAQVIAAFIIVECLQFPMIFAIIYWMASENWPLDGFFLSNEFIARDEGMHGDAGIVVYKEYIPAEAKLPQETIHQMVEGAIEADQQFVHSALGGESFPGMSPELLTQYAQFLGDQTLKEMGYEPLYNVDNPFRFMKKQGMTGRTDFFSKRVSEYRFASPSGESHSSFRILDADI